MALSKTDKVLIPALVAGGGVTAGYTWFVKKLGWPDTTYWDVIRKGWTQASRYNPLILGAIAGAGVGMGSYLIQKQR